MSKYENSRQHKGSIKVNVFAPSNGTSCRSFIYFNHSSAIVVADDDSEIEEQQEQARKDKADLVAFRAKEEKEQTAILKKKEYAKQ